jgi:hypothetical protein
MKYLGKNSLSSAVSIILRIAWWAVLAMAIFGVVVFSIMLFVKPVDGNIAAEMAKWSTDSRWQEMYTWPLAGKILIYPYFAAFLVVLLQIIKKSQELFTNFKNDVVFNKNNVAVISTISKLSIVFSILTFSFTSLLISILMFVLCEIMKKGTTLQEEHDFTV